MPVQGGEDSPALPGMSPLASNPEVSASIRVCLVAATRSNVANISPAASFEGMPAEHRGEGGFHFRVAFSEDIGISFRALREDAFTVTGGRVTGGSRVDGRRDLFRMTVRPDSDGDVTITLPAGRECATSGAICTKGENRRQLTNSPSATVKGPAAKWLRRAACRSLRAKSERPLQSRDRQGRLQMRDTRRFRGSVAHRTVLGRRFVRSISQNSCAAMSVTDSVVALSPTILLAIEVFRASDSAIT